MLFIFIRLFFLFPLFLFSCTSSRHSFPPFHHITPVLLCIICLCPRRSLRQVLPIPSLQFPSLLRTHGSSFSLLNILSWCRDGGREADHTSIPTRVLTDSCLYATDSCIYATVGSYLSLSLQLMAFVFFFFFLLFLLDSHHCPDEILACGN